MVSHFLMIPSGSEHPGDTHGDDARKRGKTALAEGDRFGDCTIVRPLGSGGLEDLIHHLVCVSHVGRSPDIERRVANAVDDADGLGRKHPPCKCRCQRGSKQNKAQPLNLQHSYASYFENADLSTSCRLAAARSVSFSVREISSFSGASSCALRTYSSDFSRRFVLR